MLLFLFIIFSCYSKIVGNNFNKKIKRFSKNNKKLILSFSFLFIVTLLLFIFFKNKKYNLEETQGEWVSLNQDASKELENTSKQLKSEETQGELISLQDALKELENTSKQLNLEETKADESDKKYNLEAKGKLVSLQDASKKLEESDNEKYNLEARGELISSNQDMFKQFSLEETKADESDKKERFIKKKTTQENLSIGQSPTDFDSSQNANRNSASSHNKKDEEARQRQAFMNTNREKIQQIIHNMLYSDCVFSFLPQNFNSSNVFIEKRVIATNICLNTFENYYQLEININCNGKDRKLNLLFPKEEQENITEHKDQCGSRININDQYNIIENSRGIYLNDFQFILHEDGIMIIDHLKAFMFEKQRNGISYNSCNSDRSCFKIKDIDINNQEIELKLNNYDDLKKISEFFESLKNTEYSGD